MQIALIAAVLGGTLATAGFFAHDPLIHTILFTCAGIALTSSIILGWTYKQRIALIVGITLIATMALIAIVSSDPYASASTALEPTPPTTEEPSQELVSRIPEQFAIARTMWSARNGELGLEIDILIYEAQTGTYEYTALLLEGDEELCASSGQELFAFDGTQTTVLLARIPCESIGGERVVIEFSDGMTTVSETAEI